MAIAHHGSSSPIGGGDPRALGLTRDRPSRTLGALSRGGWASPDQVADAQRDFIIEAMIQAAGTRGYRNVTIRSLFTTARVSRATFYDRFPSMDACFLAALSRAHDQVVHAAVLGADNPDPIAGAVVEILTLFDVRPTVARMCVVEPLAGPDQATAAHHRGIDNLTAALDACMPGPRSVVPARARRATVAGAHMLIHQQLTEPSGEPLVDLAPDILQAVRAPYGSRANNPSTLQSSHDWSTVERPPGLAVAWQREVAGEGLRKQTLHFLDSNPGSSNLQVAEHLGLTQAPASRRLAGMAKDRLIVSRKRAGRHAWFVTERGHAALTGAAAPVAAVR